MGGIDSHRGLAVGWRRWNATRQNSCPGYLGTTSVIVIGFMKPAANCAFTNIGRTEIIAAVLLTGVTALLLSLVAS